MGKRSRAVIRGSRLFNSILSLLPLGRILRGHLGTIQSGSPPDGGRRQRYTNESAAKSRPKIFEAGAFIQRFSTVEYTSLKSTVWISSPWSSVPKEGWFP